jgi:hypothetical protein
MIFKLLIIYQIKHFLADFPLQGKYMMGKFKGGTEWIKPLLAHVTVHGLFTLAICLAVKPSMWWLSILDASIHFVMDRIKASPDYLGKYKSLSAREMKQVSEDLLHSFYSPSAKRQQREKLQHNTYFWWALGIDQAVHHLTHYLIIWMLL